MSKMWKFDDNAKKYYNECEQLDKCCYYCKNRLDKSCKESCFEDAQEIELSEKYGTNFHCKNCKHK